MLFFPLPCFKYASLTAARACLGWALSGTVSAPVFFSTFPFIVGRIVSIPYHADFNRQAPIYDVGRSWIWTAVLACKVSSTCQGNRPCRGFEPWNFSLGGECSTGSPYQRVAHPVNSQCPSSSSHSRIRFLGNQASAHSFLTLYFIFEHALGGV